MDLKPWAEAALLDDAFPLPLDEPFTTAMARAEGVTPANLAWLTGRALLRRPIRGTYLAVQAGDSTALRARCLGLVVPDDAVICDRHAGWLHGAQMVLAPNEHLDLRPISVFLPPRRGRLRNELAASGERFLTKEDVVEVAGLAVTSPIRTAWDLGRVRWPERAIAGVDSLLALGAFSREDFLAGVDRFRGHRWVTTLRFVAPLGDPLSASPGESVLRLYWIDCGLPEPRCQVEVRRDGVLIARLDVGNEDLRYSAEYDGAEWHSSDEQRAHDAARRTAVDAVGWTVDPFVRDDVFSRAGEWRAMLLDGARRARVRLGRTVIL